MKLKLFKQDKNKVNIPDDTILNIINIIVKNLYTNNPIAPLCELVSNAYHNNVKANRPDAPIYIYHIWESIYKNYLEITDCGNGMSPKLFDKIDLNFNTTTSKLEILGLNVIPLLSLTNINIIITRPGDGYEYTYDLYCDDDYNICVNRCSVIESNLPTGTTIRVHGYYGNLHEYIFNYLIGYPNIHISNEFYRVDNPDNRRFSDYVTLPSTIDFDYTKLIKTEHFAYFDIDTRELPFYRAEKYHNKVLIGSRLYDIGHQKRYHMNAINWKYDKKYDGASVIIPIFKEGELDLDYNNENIAYTLKNEIAYKQKAIDIAKQLNPTLKNYDFTVGHINYLIDCKTNKTRLMGSYGGYDNYTYNLMIYNGKHKSILTIRDVVNECFMNNRRVIIYDKSLNKYRIQRIREIYGDDCMITTTKWIKECKGDSDKLFINTHKVKYLYKKGLIEYVKTLPEDEKK